MKSLSYQIRSLSFGFLVLLTGTFACQDVLSPKPVDLLSDELVLSVASDVDGVRTGLYGAFRGLGALGVVAGDFTADMGQFNGTFTVYNELCNHQITAANAAAGTLFAQIYNVVYISNFIDEKLGSVPGVPEETKTTLFAEAAFLRSYAYFMGLNTFGAIPMPETTDIESNRNIPKATVEAIKAKILEGFNRGVADLPESWSSSSATLNKSFVTKNAARAALARYYLYQGEWANAETAASAVIAAGLQSLDTSYVRMITSEFDSESIFELSYANNSSDDPGTSQFGLNNVFVGRREVIPTNDIVNQLWSTTSGTRRGSISFSSADQGGIDNGWTVRKYGSADEANNNITLFRLGETYLIRAEARVQQNKMALALADLNLIRNRAKAAVLANFTSQSSALLVIEQERLYELAYEGHRWYELKRTGRASAVLGSTANWNSKYELWPIPQAEIQRNPALRGGQNPGY